MALSPYPCTNPASQCALFPGITEINQLFGCMSLTPSSCLPSECPPLPCGACPVTCPEAYDAAECDSWLVQNADKTQDCNLYVDGLLKRVANHVPLPGCTGTCASASSLPAGSKCCSDATQDSSTKKWTFADTSDLHQAAYQDFFDLMTNCEMQTCNCPSKALADGSHVPCSGNGQCRSNNGSDWLCYCAEGFTGLDCGTNNTPGSNCPMSWNYERDTNEECGGVSRGTCNKTTKQCACTPGWSGLACNIRVCPTVNGKVCSDNGTCSLLNECICHEGFSGAACNCSTQDGKTVCEADDSASSGGLQSIPPVSPQQGEDPGFQAKKNLAKLIFVILPVVVALAGFVWVFGSHKSAKESSLDDGIFQYKRYLAQQGVSSRDLNNISASMANL